MCCLRCSPYFRLLWLFLWYFFILLTIVSLAFSDQSTDDNDEGIDAILESTLATSSNDSQSSATNQNPESDRPTNVQRTSRNQSDVIPVINDCFDNTRPTS